MSGFHPLRPGLWLMRRLRLSGKLLLLGLVFLATLLAVSASTAWGMSAAVVWGWGVNIRGTGAVFDGRAVCQLVSRPSGAGPCHGANHPGRFVYTPAHPRAR